MAALSIISFLWGVLISALGAWFIIRMTHRGGEDAKGLDQPDGLRKRHGDRISRLGGIAMFVAFNSLLVVLAVSDRAPELPYQIPVVVGVVLIFGLGLWDDFRPLSAWVKLSAQLAIAALVWFLGLRFDNLILSTTGEVTVLSPFLSFFVSVAWLVAIPNIVNLADGMDGLAGGLGFFLFLTLGVVGMLNPFQHASGILNFGLAGAMIGFLVFNFPPARIFMGDGGAYLIGFFIAASSLGSSQIDRLGSSMVVTVIALGVPILDATFSFVRRWVKGAPVTKGDSEHFHHRLLSMGLESEKALFVLYGLFALLSALALLTVFKEWLGIGLSAVFITTIGLVFLRSLGYVHTFRSLPKDLSRLLRARREVKYAVSISRTLDLEVLRTDDAERFWFLFRREIGRIGFDVLPNDTGVEVEIENPLEGVKSWSLTDQRSHREKLSRETLAGCFVSPLNRAIRKFGFPDWEGLKLDE